MPTSLITSHGFVSFQQAFASDDQSSAGKLLYTKGVYENGTYYSEVFVSAGYDIYDEDKIATATRFTHNDFTEIQPSWSPDGTKIVFASNKDALPDKPYRFSIYVMDSSDSTKVLRLTAGPRISDDFPVWSPDGKKIAFTRTTLNSLGGTTIKIAVLDLKSGQITELAGSGLYDTMASWSPDSNQIAFSARAITWPGSYLYVMNADGTNAKRISPETTDAVYTYGLPVWSLDGKKLAYLSTKGVAISNPDGSGFQIFNDTSTTNDLAWSPDGKTILLSKYNQFGTDTYDLYAINSDGTELRPLIVSKNVSESTPRFFVASRVSDGIKIDEADLKAISTSAEKTALELASTNAKFLDPVPPEIGVRTVAYVSQIEPKSKIWLLNTDGSARRKLTSENFYEYNPDWSPDGKKLAFSSNRELNDIYPAHVYTISVGADTNGTDLRQITTDPAYRDLEPSWSPDGSKIAFTRYSARGDGEIFGKICIVNADGTELRVLRGTGGQDSHPSWSPDGSKIAFSGFPNDGKTKGYGIYVMSADGKDEAVSLTRLAEGVWGTNGNLMWSPDGDKIVFTNTTGILTMDAIDGRNLKVIKKSEWLFDPIWSPDGSKIIFVGPKGTFTKESGPTEFGLFIMNPDGSGLQTFLDDGDRGNDVQDPAINPVKIAAFETSNTTAVNVDSPDIGGTDGNQSNFDSTATQGHEGSNQAQQARSVESAVDISIDVAQFCVTSASIPQLRHPT
jgi:Tol biopolymer transport system component